MVKIYYNGIVDKMIKYLFPTIGLQIKIKFIRIVVVLERT